MKPKATAIKRPGERIGNDIKRTAWGSAAESVILVIIGLLFIICPETIEKALAYIIGIFFIAKGVYNILVYYMEKGQQDFFNNGLLSGIASILIGAVVLAIGQNIAGVFRVIIGIIIIYESLVRINTASKLSSVGVDTWRSVLLLALIMLVLGIFITFNTGAVVTLIGWIMIVAGIIGIVGDIVFIKHVNIVIDKLSKK